MRLGDFQGRNICGSGVVEILTFFSHCFTGELGKAVQTFLKAASLILSGLGGAKGWLAADTGWFNGVGACISGYGSDTSFPQPLRTRLSPGE